MSRRGGASTPQGNFPRKKPHGAGGYRLHARPGALPLPPQQSQRYRHGQPPVFSSEAFSACHVPNDPLASVFSRYRVDRQFEVIDIPDVEPVSVADNSMDVTPAVSDSPCSSDDTHLTESPPSISAPPEVVDLDVAPPEVVEIASSVDSDSEGEDDDDIQIIAESITTNRQTSEVICISEASSSTSIQPSQQTVIEFAPALEDTLVAGTMQMFKKAVRVWEEVKPLRKGDAKSTVFRICSYNVLCQNTIGTTMYLYRHLSNDKAPLYWEQRWPGLQQNLQHINADIFGLQEVQETHFEQYFKPLMSRMGYGVLYCAKRSPAVDGCAFFYKQNKFEYVISNTVSYFVGEDTIMDKPQIAQIVRLRCRTTKKEIVVANTHILFNMKRGDIKIGQISMLFAHIHQELKKNGKAPVIILGDFNIHPNSHIFEYILQSKIFLHGLPRAELAGDKTTNRTTVVTDEIMPVSTGIARDSMFIDPKVPREDVAPHTFTHPLELWSAMAPSSHSPHLMRNGISTFHADFGNPDFIFYSVKEKYSEGKLRNVVEYPSLRLHRRMSLPKLDMLQKTLGPWPNYYVPSDHIPLVAEFQLRAVDEED